MHKRFCQVFKRGLSNLFKRNGIKKLKFDEFVESPEDLRNKICFKKHEDVSSKSANIDLISDSGELIPVRMFCSPIKDKFNDKIGYLFVGHDLSNEIELQNRNYELKN